MSIFGCNCYLKSVRYGGQEVMDVPVVVTTGAPFEFIVSGKAGTVEGTVVDRDDKPVAGAAVALIPGDGSLVRLKTGATDAAGRFFWNGNMPGNYKLVAWESADPASLQDPGFLRRFDGAAKTVVVEAYSKASVQVTAQR